MVARLNQSLGLKLRSPNKRCDGGVKWSWGCRLNVQRSNSKRWALEEQAKKPSASCFRLCQECWSCVSPTEHLGLHLYITEHLCQHLYITEHLCLLLYITDLCLHLYITVHLCLHLYITVHLCLHLYITDPGVFVAPILCLIPHPRTVNTTTTATNGHTSPVTLSELNRFWLDIRLLHFDSRWERVGGKKKKRKND